MGRGHFAVGPGAQRSPQTGGQEFFNDLGSGQLVRAKARLLIENLFLVPLELDDNGLKGTFRSPVDGDHLAAAGGSVGDARVFLVLEEDLPEPDPVSFLDRHCRPHADVVRSQYGDLLYRAAILDELPGRARYGKGPTLS